MNFSNVYHSSSSSSITPQSLSLSLKLQSGLTSKLEDLRDRMLIVEPLLSIAERRLSRSSSSRDASIQLSQLLRKLEDAAYDAEDLLDEFALRHHLHKSSCGCFDVARRVITCDKFTTKIGAIREKLDTVSNSVTTLLHLLDLDAHPRPTDNDNDNDGGPNAPWRTQTTPFVDENMVGRDEEKNRIITSLLLSSTAAAAAAAGNGLSVVPIFGMGGVGKTTLARSVFKDPQVEKVFGQLRIWVCVSDDFNVARLTKEILELVVGTTLSSSSNLTLLQTELHKALMSKSFLLVLDDVWKPNDHTGSLRNKWEQLLGPLVDRAAAAQGGESEINSASQECLRKIIVTTRDQEVAGIMGTIDPVELGRLQPDIFMELFISRAFQGVDPDHYPTLRKDMAEKIAKKLGGLPLAAKTVGALLNSNMKEEHWKKILESEIWELDQSEDGVIPALRVSYIHLPPHLKQCFAYSALFPKHYHFKREYLVQQWLAHGYIIQPENSVTDVEVIGGEYFDLLVRRSFFQHIYEHYYVMHDLIHDLAQSIYAHHCFQIKKGKQYNKIPKTVRHISICTSSKIDISQLERSCDLKKLRTVVFLYKSDMSEMITGKLKRVRVLDLAGTPIERRLMSAQQVKAIASLKHLRFLNLNRTIYEVPKEMCSLFYLQVLYFYECKKIFPKQFNNLINLRHLRVLPYETFTMIAGIGKLKNLQELERFTVLNKPGHELSELKDMNQLRSLRIDHLESVADKQKAEEANLLRKENLEELTLSWWSRDANKEGTDNDNGVLEGLRPSPSLKKLEIRGHIGPNPPSWMNMEMLPRLERLTLDSCHKWEVLPPTIGQLPSLKFLELWLCHNLLALPEELQQVFPSLRGLSICRCPEIRSLPSGGLPPALKRLTILNCHRELHLRCRRGEGEDCPKIQHIPDLNIVEDED